MQADNRMIDVTLVGVIIHQPRSEELKSPGKFLLVGPMTR